MRLPRVDPLLQQRVRQVLDSYGKIGLLIDDAREARGRAARAIYGSEVLPEWWLVGRSLRCAYSLLRALREELREQKELRCIAIIDRYLMVSCEPPSARLVAWDGGPWKGLQEDDVALCQGLEETVSSLVESGDDRARHPAFFVELETSYPHGFWDRTGEDGREPLPVSAPGQPRSRGRGWRTRSTDLLFRLRGRIERGPPSLLAYGPYERSPVLSAPRSAAIPEPAGDEPSWRARTWQPALEDLAAAFQGQSAEHPVILFTGVGTSLRTGRFSRGMAPTDRLLQGACQRIIAGDRNRWPNPKPIAELDTSAYEDPCACRATTAANVASGPGTERPRWNPTSGDTPVEWMLDLVAAEQPVARLDWNLEELFSAKQNIPPGEESKRKIFEQFCNAFRAELHRYDNGFLYHHWLLAQFPWTRIVTTNFDNFHERAAAAAAASQQLGPNKRDAILRLGCRLPNVPPQVADADHELSADPLAKLRQSRGLFKPYGSLLYPAALGLGLEQLESCQEHLEAELKALIEPATTVWLVVIGHSMRDPYLNELLIRLKDLKNPNRFPGSARLLWVDPSALERTIRAKPGSLIWDQWMLQRWKDGLAGPLPASAHEFVYDLWQVFRKA